MTDKESKSDWIDDKCQVWRHRLGSSNATSKTRLSQAQSDSVSSVRRNRPQTKTKMKEAAN